jgi:hypothetical protein
MLLLGCLQAYLAFYVDVNVQFHGNHCHHWPGALRSIRDPALHSSGWQRSGGFNLEGPADRFPSRFPHRQEVMCYRGLIVDIIRHLWDHGLYRDNKWLKMCHDYWFDYWVEYKTQATMKDVDEQVAELNPEPVSVPDPIYWEETEGETLLGGSMGLSYDFVDRSGSSSDPVQGAE